MKTLVKKYNLQKAAIALLSMITLCSFQLHKHYMSLCEVNYAEDKKSLQIITSIFIDDFQKSMNKEIDRSFDIDNSQKKTDKLCLEYLQKHLSFKINGKDFDYNYIGKEFGGNKVFFYLEINNVETISELQITNNLLIKQFKDQKNIIKVHTSKKEQTFYLNYEKHSAIYKP